MQMPADINDDHPLCYLIALTRGRWFSARLQKIHVMPDMSGVVARLCREFRGAFGAIWLAPNSAHKGILVSVTSDTGPKRSRKWPKE